MERITLDIPDEALSVLAAPGRSRQDVGEELVLLAAAKLYELGRLSSGAAARLAGIPRVAFLARLASLGISTFELTEEELAGEARLADRRL